MIIEAEHKTPKLMIAETGNKAMITNDKQQIKRQSNV